MNINNVWFYESTLLHILYMYGSISSENLEGFFNYHHGQNINNIISDRSNSTSLFYKGYMKYDEDKREISITSEGKRFIEEEYSGRRSS